MNFKTYEIEGRLEVLLKIAFSINIIFVLYKEDITVCDATWSGTLFTQTNFNLKKNDLPITMTNVLQLIRGC